MKLSFNIYKTKTFNWFYYLINSSLMIWVLVIILIGTLVYLQKKKKIITNKLKKISKKIRYHKIT